MATRQHLRLNAAPEHLSASGALQRLRPRRGVAGHDHGERLLRRRRDRQGLLAGAGCLHRRRRRLCTSCPQLHGLRWQLRGSDNSSRGRAGCDGGCLARLWRPPLLWKRHHHVLIHWPGHLRHGLHVDEAGDLYGHFVPQFHRFLDYLFDVVHHRLGNLLRHQLGHGHLHLLHDLTVFHLWHLDHPLLLHNVWNLDDFLDVLEDRL
mmetsp:Transcript_17267/g.48063  ORF Transcript_17267/g.48063 Transcript_17267/m.48063 type:complete len:206 (+) Transcript_17267:619-1236(+)